MCTSSKVPKQSEAKQKGDRNNVYHLWESSEDWLSSASTQTHVHSAVQPNVKYQNVIIRYDDTNEYENDVITNENFIEMETTIFNLEKWKDE